MAYFAPIKSVLDKINVIGSEKTELVPLSYGSPLTIYDNDVELFTGSKLRFIAKGEGKVTFCFRDIDNDLVQSATISGSYPINNPNNWKDHNDNTCTDLISGFGGKITKVLRTIDVGKVDTYLVKYKQYMHSSTGEAKIWISEDGDLYSDFVTTSGATDEGYKFGYFRYIRFGFYLPAGTSITSNDYRLYTLEIYPTKDLDVEETIISPKHQNKRLLVFYDQSGNIEYRIWKEDYFI